MRRQSFSIFIAAGILIAGLFFGFIWGQNSQVAVPASVADGAFSLMIDFGDGRIITYPEITLAPNNPNRNLFSLMQKTLRAAGQEFDFNEYQNLGMLVTRIGDKQNGENSKYWQYWVNNRFAATAANNYIVRDGDVIEWKFINQQYEK